MEFHYINIVLLPYLEHLTQNNLTTLFHSRSYLIIIDILIDYYIMFVGKCTGKRIIA